MSNIYNILRIYKRFYKKIVFILYCPVNYKWQEYNHGQLDILDGVCSKYADFPWLCLLTEV